jgi:hypothetical protein
MTKCHACGINIISVNEKEQDGHLLLDIWPELGAKCLVRCTSTKGNI